MRKSFFILLLGFSISFQTFAVGMKLWKSTPSTLGIQLIDLQLPDSIRKDLKSGLTNKFLFIFRIQSQGSEEIVIPIELSIKYDLWDETYSMTIVANSKTKTSFIPKIEDVLSQISNFRWPDLMDFSKWPKNAKMKIQGSIILNPIEKERMEQIKKWVLQNSSISSSGSGSNEGGFVSGIRHHKIFDKIFEEKTSGSKFATQWVSNMEATSYSLEDLTYGK